MTNYKENRPWGTFENLLDKDYCKVKEIIINPEQRPSYQYHHRRSETWIIVKGIAKVTLDDIEKTVVAGDVVKVPIGCKHRIENKSSSEDLIFIEVQHGDYFGEDDIVRVSDDYKR
jgi:mannose-6-phosphate isomerase-like protein (cupin superfamily)